MSDDNVIVNQPDRHLEAVSWRPEFDRMNDPSTPALERAAFWWEHMAAWLAVDCGPAFNLREHNCRRALYSLARAIVDAELTPRVEALADPIAVSGRGPAIALLKRVVLVEHRHAEHVLIDQELRRLIASVIDDWRGEIAHFARQTLSHSLRREVLGDERATSDQSVSSAPSGLPDSTEPVMAGECPVDDRDREEKVRAALAALLTIGPNATRIADAVGVPRTTLLGWETFRLHYDRAKRDAEARKTARRGNRTGASDFEADQDDD